MPPRRIVVAGGEDWVLAPSAPAGRRRAAGGAPALGADPLVARLLATGKVEVASDEVATPSPRRAAEGALILDVPTAPGEALVLLARHPSGAITLHSPQPLSGRRGTARGGVTRFHVAVRSAGAGARRGAVTRVVRLVVFKALDKVAELVLPRLARRWEEGRFGKRPLGWVGITAPTLRAAIDGSGQLAPAPKTAFGERNLLLLHGTFSSTEGAFAKLAGVRGADGGEFLSWANGTYGGRIFGFNHLTVSAPLAENARLLLDGLPDRPVRFDVVTHSRGGLVLRTLLERRAELGSPSRRFELDRGVLVAAPNQGTPLGSAERWDDTLGWLANLIDLFPDNPFTLAAEFVAEGLNWIAQHVVGDLPGLAAMDPAGVTISGLQGPPGPPPGTLAALAANFEPGDHAPRLFDAGADGFFAGANDLVVPSEGGWLVGESDGIPGERIGSYGPGGNLAGDRVHHLNFFSQPATVDFLKRALEGRDLGLRPLDPAQQLPFRGRFRRAGAAPTRPAEEAARPAAAGAAVEAPPPPAAAPAEPAATPAPEPAPRRREAGEDGAAWSRDALQLFILAHREDGGRRVARRHRRGARDANAAQLLATYRNARVIAPFHTGDGKAGRRAPHVLPEVIEAGSRFQKIITFDDQVRSYVDGDPKVTTLPGDSQLREVGERLFASLFPGEVQRLYDEVRSSHQGRRLDIVLTSMIPWVAALPWEFAFDPQRKTFLATEEINFIRNVETAIPADLIASRPAPLRILVVAAQPIGTGALSVEEEIELVGRGFRGLREAGLITYDVVRETTPETLHKRLLHAQLAGVPFDVLHFIGHGEYDEKDGKGYLLFENEAGGVSRVETGTLRQILCRRGLRLVFLNACETGLGGRSEAHFDKEADEVEVVPDFNRGVAPGLVAGGVPVVVGNQYKVLDPSATAFAQHFYWALARGATIGDAAREARVAVNYSISGDAIDWAVPVVFAQNPCERLCQAPAEEPGAAAVTVSTTVAPVVGRRGRRGGARPRRVGLWDVNHSLPGLRAIAHHLEEVQGEYEFEVVDLTAPLGTWRLERPQDGEPQGYLYAEGVAERLRDRPAQLGLDYLFCITTFRLSARPRNLRGLFSWDKSEEGIVLVSLASYKDAFGGPDLPLERALANVVAGCLSGINEHHRGPKDCPAYFNPERDPRWVAGPLRFCPECNAKLAKAITAEERPITAEERQAVEALLTAYDGAVSAPPKAARKPRSTPRRTPRRKAAAGAQAGARRRPTGRRAPR